MRVSTLNVLATCTAISSCAVAFSPSFLSGPKSAFRSSKLYMSDDFPSDSSVEALYETTAAYDVESHLCSETESETLVNSILNELPASLVSGAGLSKDARAKINEALLKLEAMNPTENPTSSPLLNGVWSLRYAVGYSPEWALPSPTR